MTGTLRVTPQALISASQEFQSAAGDVQRLTGSMIDLIRRTCSYAWQGDASATFLRKFNTLQDDMNRMYRKISEHSTDLTQMARNYGTAEDHNIGNYSYFNENPIA